MRRAAARCAVRESRSRARRARHGHARVDVGRRRHVLLDRATERTTRQGRPSRPSATHAGTRSINCHHQSINQFIDHSLINISSLTRQSDLIDMVWSMNDDVSEQQFSETIDEEIDQLVAATFDAFKIGTPLVA